MSDSGLPPPVVVPRPAGARPGGPPPWAELSSGERQGVTVARVRRSLEAAGLAGAPPPVGTWSAEPPLVVLDGGALRASAIPGAVLLALFEEQGEARVVLTRRSSRLRRHTGQVSFPGGRLEPGEEPWDAARRESQEEVGLAPGFLDPAGWLHAVLTMAESSLILPVVGALGRRPELTANPSEVARVFDVGLGELLDVACFSEERWPIPVGPGAPGRLTEHPVYFFDVAGEMVWGATARILVELLRLVTGTGGERGGASAVRRPWTQDVPRAVEHRTDSLQPDGIVEDRRGVGPAITPASPEAAGAGVDVGAEDSNPEGHHG